MLSFHTHLISHVLFWSHQASSFSFLYLISLLFRENFLLRFVPFFPSSLYLLRHLLGFPPDEQKTGRKPIYLNFFSFWQARYWGSGVNEVQGAIHNHNGKVIHRLFGKWHEGLYRGVPPVGKCLWKSSKKSILLRIAELWGSISCFYGTVCLFIDQVSPNLASSRSVSPTVSRIPRFHR